MTATASKLPYSVGRLTPKWALLVLGLMSVTGLGVYAYEGGR